jgi:hypothetical protein
VPCKRGIQYVIYGDKSAEAMKYARADQIGENYTPTVAYFFILSDNTKIT